MASLSAGPIIDIKGNKLALLVGLALIVISLVCGAECRRLRGLLLFVYFVLAWAAASWSRARMRWWAPWTRRRRGSALNFLNLFFGLGGIITTYVASEHVNPSTVCYMIAALTAITLW